MNWRTRVEYLAGMCADGYTTKDLIFEWREADPIQSTDPKPVLPEFVWVGYELGDCTVSYITGQHGSYLSYTFTEASHNTAWHPSAACQIHRQYYLVFAVFALAFGLSAQYLPSAFGLGQILSTSAKYQGKYCKHQVMLYLLYDSDCCIERITNQFPHRYKKILL